MAVAMALFSIALFNRLVFVLELQIRNRGARVLLRYCKAGQWGRAFGKNGDPPHGGI